MKKTLARRNTRTPAPAPRRLYGDTPQRIHTQDQMRERRRGWLRVHYRGDFDLAAEVTAILTPLTGPLAALPHPGALRRDIDEVTDAVHELVSAVVGMLAESRHLDHGAKARTTRAVFDLAQRPAEPQIGDEDLADGSWARALVGHVKPYTRDFAAFLDRALPPDDPRLGKQDCASQRLEAALRVLDTAALDLARRIPKAARYQSLPSIDAVNAARKSRDAAERAQHQLAKMGATP